MNSKAVSQAVLMVAILKGLEVRCSCPMGDSTPAGDGSDIDDGNFYLDFFNLADCSGTVSRIQYCYQNSAGLAINTTEARIGVYRRTGTTVNRVSEEFVVTNHVPFSGSSGSVCEILELEPPIVVNEMDMFGVCLLSSSGETLPVVSGGFSRVPACSVELVDSVSLFSYSIHNDLKLHLSANVTPEPSRVNETPTTANFFTTAASDEMMPTMMPTEITTQDFKTAAPPTEILPHTTGEPDITTDTSSPTDSPPVTDQEIASTDLLTTSNGSELPNGTTVLLTGSISTEGLPQTDQLPDITGFAGRIAGIAIALTVIIMAVVTVAAIAVVTVVLRKKKMLYFVKPRSTLARNGFSTEGIAEYEEVEDNGREPAQHTKAESYTNPYYFQVQDNENRTRRGKKSECYYTPDTVMYSELTPQPFVHLEQERTYQAPARLENELYAQLGIYGINKISRRELESHRHLGSGQFGSVASGVWMRSSGEKEVALKTLKTEENVDMIKLLQEAVIMVQFQHPNVLYLYGVAGQDEMIVLVTELAHNGDLREYLLSMKLDPVTSSLPKLLLSFSQHVAQGMHYLSSKGFIHRDLAARNILVTKDNTCKVADFGMSRDLVDGTYYVSSGGKVPLKWTAPESLHYNKFSTASDVWSYGCVLYEIWSMGTKPFSKVKNDELIDFIDGGKRLAPPSGCPRVLYQTMISCWHPNSSSRPSFQDILTALRADEEKVLEIPADAAQSHPKADTLGAPIEAGAGMYQDICKKYCRRYSPVTCSDMDYDDITG